jgi:hypothetical protein
MLIYEDLFGKEEIISDSYDIKYLFNDVVGEVQSNMVVKDALKVDVGCGDAFGGGGDDEKADD